MSAVEPLTFTGLVWVEHIEHLTPVEWYNCSPDGVLVCGRIPGQFRQQVLERIAPPIHFLTLLALNDLECRDCSDSRLGMISIICELENFDWDDINPEDLDDLYDREVVHLKPLLSSLPETARIFKAHFIADAEYWYDRSMRSKRTNNNESRATT